MTTTTAYTNINISAINSLGDMTNAMNASVGGYLFFGIDIMIFLTMLISLAGIFGWESAMLTSGFVAVILSIMFTAMGLISFTKTAIFVGIILVMIMYVMWNNRSQ